MTPITDNLNRYAQRNLMGAMRLYLQYTCCICVRFSVMWQVLFFSCRYLPVTIPVRMAPLWHVLLSLFLSEYLMWHLLLSLFRSDISLLWHVLFPLQPMLTWLTSVAYLWYIFQLSWCTNVLSPGSRWVLISSINCILRWFWHLSSVSLRVRLL